MTNIALYSNAQQASIFKQYTTADGLPSNYVFDIEKDENGFLWIGTDKGLAKYDGFHWQTFNTDNGLPGNYVNKIYPTYNGGLWITFSAKGLYYYDIKSGKLTIIIKNFDDATIKSTLNGDLFYSNTINSKNDTIVGYHIKHDQPTTPKIAFKIEGEIKKIKYCIDLENRSVFFNSANQIKCDFEGSWKKDNNIFTNNLESFFSKKSPSIYIDHSSAYFVEENRLTKTVNVFPNNNIYFNGLVDNNKIWLWNIKDGLYLVNKNGVEQHYNVKNGLTNNFVNDVFKTNSGNILIATLGSGLFSMMENGNTKIDLNNNLVNSIVLHNENLYALQNDYVLQINIKKPSIISKFLHKENNTLSINAIEDKIIINKLNGSTVFQKNNNTLFKTNSIADGAGISSVFYNQNNYYTTSFGTYLKKFDCNFKYISTDTNSFNLIEKNFILNKKIAFVNYEDGLQIWDYKNTKHLLSTSNGLSSNSVFDVHEMNDTLWISNSKGLDVFCNNKKIKTFASSQYFIGEKCIFSFHDKIGNYWVVTNKHLNLYKNSSFNIIGSIQLLENLNENITNCAFNKKNNTLITSTKSNIYFTNLNNIITIYKNNDTIQLLQFAIDGKSTKLEPDISVATNFKSIQFLFKPLKANPFGSSTIFYKLDGPSHDFVILKDSLQITFANLRSGNYKLLVKSIDANGIESYIQTIASFSIKPPFIQTPLFYTLCGIGIAGLLFGSIAYTQRKKRKKIEQQQVLERSLSNERERISKDLHDHLGTAIVTIIAQTDNIESKLINNNIADALSKVKELSEQSRNTVNVLRETIWAVQENSHTINIFIQRTKKFLQRILPQKDIEWKLEFEGNENVVLTANQSLQLFRIIQECTQNIVKHANASKALYHLNIQQNILHLTITDDGKGIDMNNISQGFGLNNINERIKNINGTVEYKNGEINGFTVSIKIAI